MSYSESKQNYETDYLNKEMYPLTSQEGLTLKEQQLIDAFNHDKLTEAKRNNSPNWTQEVQARYDELTRKLSSVGLLPTDSQKWNKAHSREFLK